MKRIIVMINVPDETEIKLGEEIIKLVEKAKGKVTDIQVSVVSPKGSGATLAGVA